MLKESKFRGYVFIIVLVSVTMCPLSLSASVRTDGHGSNNFIQLNELKNELTAQENDIGVLGKKIKAIEKTVGDKNKKYLLTVKQRQDIESLLNSGKTNLAKNERRLRERFVRVQMILKGLVLETLANENRPEDLVARKILMKEMTFRAKNLKENIEYNEVLRQQISDLESRYQDYLRVEKELSSLLYDLEEQKRTVSEDYHSRIKMKSEVKQRFIKLQEVTKDKTLKTVGMEDVLPDISYRFTAPLAQASIELKNKGQGVFFKFSGIQPVQATADGTVVFSGELSTFGKLIMLDHGDGLRSVILGQMRPTISKGVQVKKGDVVGYTEDKGIGDAKVYFEVRQGSKVRHTLGLMDDIFKKNYKM